HTIYRCVLHTYCKRIVALLLGLVLSAITYVTSKPEYRPTFDWHAAYWLVPYLGGLAAISYLGATDFGGTGLFPFGWDALVVAIFSIVIYVLALRLRLTDAKAREYIAELSAEAEAEAEILGPSLAG